jgi:hypothetical protein
MKWLIAVGSCEAYERKGNNDAMRNTWLEEASKLGIPHRFFHGFGATQKDDVVIVPCDDSYGGLMQKDKWMYAWAIEQGYDYVYRCDHDSYCRPERLLKCEFEKYDLAGCKGPMNSIEGGPGFFISNRACQIYVDEIEEACKGHVIQGKYVDTDYHNSYLNDWWTTALVTDHNLIKAGSSSFVHLTSIDEMGPRKNNNYISAHLSTIKGKENYSPSFMLQKHQEWLNSTGDGWIGANFITF